MGAPKNYSHITPQNIADDIKHHVTLIQSLNTDLIPSIYSTVNSNSATWEDTVNKLYISDFNNYSGNIQLSLDKADNVYSTVQNNSGNWGGGVTGNFLSISDFNIYSGDIQPSLNKADNVYSTVLSNSSTWNITGGGSSSIKNVSWTGSNWTSLSASESESKIQDALLNVGLKDFVSNLTYSNSNELLKVVGTGTPEVSLSGVAKWTLNNTLADSFSTHTLVNNNVTFVNDVTFPLGSTKKIASFNGTTSYLSTPNVDMPYSNSARTYTAWVKTPLSSPSSPVILSYGSLAAGGECFLAFRSGYIAFDGYAVTAVASTTPIAQNTWYHVAITYDTSTLKLYLNGILEATATVTLGTIQNSDVYIGRRFDNNSNSYYTGYIADVRVYTRALNATEIGYIYVGDTGSTIYYGRSNIKDTDIKTSNVGVYRNIYIDAGSMVSNITNGAAISTTESSTNKIMLDAYDFDAVTSESIQFKLVMPDEWDRNSIKAKFYWTNATTPGTGNVTFGIKGIALSNDDAIDTSFGTPQVINDTFITSGDLHITSATPAITIGGTPSLSDLIIFNVYRDISDTYTQDARLLGVEIQYKELTVEPVIW